VNFDTGPNAVAPGTNKPFAAYWPTTDSGFAAMPTVAIVVPNLLNDMHDGSISQGDAWFWNNLSAYYQWARTHNSLLVLTFDEDDSSATNQIFTLFLGPMVAPGLYANRITHFNLLRTIEDMYGLGYAGAAASASPITVGWTTSVPGTPTLNAQAGDGQVSLSWPAIAGAQGYNVYRGTASNSETPFTSVVGGTGYIDTAVAKGTTYYYEITAVNANGEGARSNEANAAPNGGTGFSTPFGGTPWPIPGKIEAEDFDECGQLVSYYDTTAGNAYGAYRSTSVDIEATSDTGGGYDVAKTKTGEWLKYTVNVTAAGTYPLTLRVANAGSGATVHVEVDGVDKTGPIAVPNTGGWQIWQTTPPTNIAFTAGQHVIRLAMDTSGSADGVGNYNWLQFGSSSPPPPGNTPFGGTPCPIPGTFEAENFDDGGQGVAYYDTSSGNVYGAYRSTDVDIETTGDTSGSYDVAKVKAGEWLKYTVNVTAAGTYPLTVRVANVGTGGKFHVEVDGVDKTGPINVPDTGGWQTWTALPGPSISLTAGTHVIRVSFDAVGSGGGGGNYNWFKVGP